MHERIAGARDGLGCLAHDAAATAALVAQASTALENLEVEHHRHEKAIVGLELQLARASDEGERLAHKAALIANERRHAEEERASLDGRQAEAHASILRLAAEQKTAEDRLALAQRRLLETREAVEAAGRCAAESKALHAALIERVGALELEVQRLDEAARELGTRFEGLLGDLRQAEARHSELRTSIAESTQLLDAEMKQLEIVSGQLRSAEEALAAIRSQAAAEEEAIRAARRQLEASRAGVSELEVARATVDGDLLHLAAACQEALQAPLEVVANEVQRLAHDGRHPSTVDASSDDTDEEGGEEAGRDVGCTEAADSAVEDSARRESGQADPRGPSLEPEQTIAAIRSRIDRLGPVNMMAIDQFDELEARYAFMTTQRQDLVDSIAGTEKAIERIDGTTKERFREAFSAISANFQDAFATLFGGGRAGLVLLDETDLLESGIEIVAQPPGKRLQNVQLLSGGEKALTAIAFMFAVFKYKPSPFCLLDEIDAPLDDANIGRFIDMLRGMMDHTQFILVTHNRQTMEIADRLYGVTMEEPGVSKLVSLRLN